MRIIKQVLGPKAGPRPSFDFGNANETDADVHADRGGDGGPDGRAADRRRRRSVHDRRLTAALFGLLTVEARHAAWARHIVGATPGAGGVRRAADAGLGAAARSRRTHFIVRRAEDDGARSRRASRADAPARGAAGALAVRRGRDRGGGARAARRVGPPARRRRRRARRARCPPPRRARRSARAAARGSARAAYLSHWAPVRRAALARAAPDRGARRSSPRLATHDARGHAQRRRGRSRAGQDAAARPWVRVRLAVLPNGTTGWVPRAALGGYGTVDTRLDVDLERAARDALPAAGRSCARRSASGAPAAPTPRGRFYVRNRLTRYRSPAYGPVAFGTSARSPTADRLARRRLRRHPRHRPPGPHPRPRLARLHPHAQRRHPRAGAADAGRHAGADLLAQKISGHHGSRAARNARSALANAPGVSSRTRSAAASERSGVPPR